MSILSQTTIWFFSIAFSIFNALPMAVIARMQFGQNHNNNEHSSSSSSHHRHHDQSTGEPSSSSSSSSSSASRRESFYNYQKNLRHPKSELRQLCGQHLRYAIGAMCKSRGYFSESWENSINPEVESNVKETNSTRMAQENNHTTPRHTNGQDLGHVSTAQPTIRTTKLDQQVKIGRLLPIVIEGHNIALQRRLPRQVVDECCERPCKEEAMLKYCSLFNFKKPSTREDQFVTPGENDIAQNTETTSFSSSFDNNVPYKFDANRRYKYKDKRKGQLGPWKTLRRTKNALVNSGWTYGQRPCRRNTKRKDALVRLEIRVIMKPIRGRSQSYKVKKILPQRSAPLLKIKYFEAAFTDDLKSFYAFPLLNSFLTTPSNFWFPNKNSSTVVNPRRVYSFPYFQPASLESHENMVGGQQQEMRDVSISQDMRNPQRHIGSWVQSNHNQIGHNKNHIHNFINDDQSFQDEQQRYHGQSFGINSNNPRSATVEHFHTQLQDDISRKLNEGDDSNSSGQSKNREGGRTRGRSQALRYATTRPPEPVVFPIGVSDQVLHG